MDVYFSQLGCKLNQAEVERMVRDFLEAGHRVVDSLERADLHVVNTCTVTHVAARDSRKLARRGARLRPGLRTVLTGCYATGSSEEARALAGVDLVVPNGEKEALLERVERAFPEWAAVRGPVTTPAERVDVPVSYVPLPASHSRLAVKIEDGCNMRCSFCIIPLVRGGQRSRPPHDVLIEVRDLESRGAREIVITGVQISSYRHGDARLFDVVARLLDQTGVPRFRLTSIAPWQFDRRLLELWDSGRLCRHVHLSLQSGCDATLRRMRRPYTSRQFADLAAELRERIPGLAITTDVIVGFPGETDEDFDESLAFVETTGFARVHAFPYSVREGTSAAEMADHVEPQVKKGRMRRMLAVADRCAVEFGRRHLGDDVEVLWEDEREGVWRGTTDHYLRVESPQRPSRPLELRRLSETWSGRGALPVLPAGGPTAVADGARDQESVRPSSP